MKTPIAILIFFCFAACLQAQSVMVVTNAGSVETISNGMVVASVPIVPMGANPTDIANSLGIPSVVLDIVPAKWLAYLVLLVWLAPYALRAYHAYQLGGSTKQIAAAVALGTNIPKAMVVQDTGQPVVPAVPPKV